MQCSGGLVSAMSLRPY